MARSRLPVDDFSPIAYSAAAASIGYALTVAILFGSWCATARDPRFKAMEGMWRPAVFLRVAVIAFILIGVVGSLYVGVLIGSPHRETRDTGFVLAEIVAVTVPVLVIAICVFMPLYLLNLARRMADRRLEFAVLWRGVALPAAILGFAVVVVLGDAYQSRWIDWLAHLLALAIYLVIFAWLFDQFRRRIAQAMRRRGEAGHSGPTEQQQ